MNRKPIPPEVQAAILSACRRRCAVCYGLHRDVDLKKGQIAHLDKDPANNDPSNLMFLCFDHHDEYDSTTRQSKNLTLHELREYRRQLIQQLETWAPPSPTLTIPGGASLTVNVTSQGGAGGSSVFGGAGGGGGAAGGAGGAGGEAARIPGKT